MSVTQKHIFFGERQSGLFFVCNMFIMDIKDGGKMKDYSFITLTEKGACGLLPRRSELAHKGSFGTLLAVCGCENYIGAACMSIESALKSGVGIACLASVKPVVAACAARCVEATFLPFDADSEGHIPLCAADRIIEKSKSASAMLIGCGLGRSEDTARLVKKLLADTEVPKAVDADGLNCAADEPQLLKNCIITPHAGEMARLCGCDISEIKADAAKSALEFAAKYGCVVVLKDADTVVAAPDGRLFLNIGRNSGLARGGSGDVLAGITASLLAQKMEPFKAAIAAVTLHSIAAKRCAEKFSARGMLPHEISDCLREIFRENGL